MDGFLIFYAAFVLCKRHRRLPALNSKTLNTYFEINNAEGNQKFKVLRTAEDVGPYYFI